MSQICISIIICTCGRASLLKEGIFSIISQQFSKELYEILVVNDHASDSTSEVVAEFSRQHSNVREVINQGNGLLKARFTGQIHAKGHYIGYFDDDAKSCSDWLQRAATIIETQKPVCFGGPFFPFYISQKPEWYKDEYGTMTRGDVPRYLSGDEVLCGGNIFFHRESLIASGGFDPDFTKPGEFWTYGDEEVPQKRLRVNFPDKGIYYDPNLYILHLVRPERLSIIRAARECFAMGRAHVKVSPPPPEEIRCLPYFRRFIQSQFAFVWSCMAGMVNRDRKYYKHYFSYIYEEAFKSLRGAGLFYETSKIIKSRKLFVQKKTALKDYKA
jgi:glycosyltransferase involved in cell wall biosynthesis